MRMRPAGSRQTVPEVFKDCSLMCHERGAWDIKAGRRVSRSGNTD